MIRTLLTIIFVFMLAVPANAVIYWDDEQQILSGTGAVGQPTFGTPSDGPPSTTTGHYIDTSIKFSGTASHRYNYFDLCQASPTPTNPQSCGGWTDRNFPETNEHYGRLYFRVSNNFQWGAPNGQTKIWGVRSNTGPSKLWFNFYFGLGMIVSAENTPVTGSTSNLPSNGSIGTMPREQFQCFEWHLINNNPAGTPNGTLQTWMNGVQTHLSTNVQWRGPGNNSVGWGQIRLYRQSGGPQQLGAGQTAHIWFDRIAVGSTRIGCIGSNPEGDQTPPATPTNWTIH